MTPTRERILIVESDPDISDLIARQSLQPLGYQVTVAGDAAAAIKNSLQNPPDLLVANLNLPGLSGKDLLVALASQGVRAPLMVIAEKGQEHDVIQAFRLGATDVLFWPARDAEVVAAVERALRQTHEARERQKLDRQLKQTNEELQRRVRDLTSLLTIGKAVISITNQRTLFERIIESALQIAEAHIGWLLLRDEKTKVFLLSAHKNLPGEGEKKTTQPLDDGISSLVALSGESLIMHGQPLEKFKISTLGKSAGVIPIKVHNEVIGLLVIVRKTNIEIDRASQTLLEAVADYSSISLVNASLFRTIEQTAAMAQAGEKSRMAALDSIRNTIREETPTALQAVNTILNYSSGTLTEEQRVSLQTAQASLQRLNRAAEKTVVPGAPQRKA